MLYRIVTLIAMLATAQGLVVGAASHGSARAAPVRMEMPLTKVVATIGPASEELDTLEKCVKAGFSIMRCNFSHATPEEFFLRVGNLRKAEGGERVSLMCVALAHALSLALPSLRLLRASSHAPSSFGRQARHQGPRDPHGRPQGVQGDGQPQGEDRDGGGRDDHPLQRPRARRRLVRAATHHLALSLSLFFHRAAHKRPLRSLLFLFFWALSLFLPLSRLERTRSLSSLTRSDEKLLYVGYERLAEKVVPGTKVHRRQHLLSSPRLSSPLLSFHLRPSHPTLSHPIPSSTSSRPIPSIGAA
jgi:hypothetical protein